MSPIGALDSGACVIGTAARKKSDVRSHRIVHRSCTGNAEKGTLQKPRRDSRLGGPAERERGLGFRQTAVRDRDQSQKFAGVE